MGINSTIVLILSTLPSLLLTSYEMVKSLLKHQVGVDVLAIISMSGALDGRVGNGSSDCRYDRHRQIA
jgi:hypothetical protein